MNDSLLYSYLYITAQLPTKNVCPLCIHAKDMNTCRKHTTQLLVSISTEWWWSKNTQIHIHEHIMINGHISWTVCCVATILAPQTPLCSWALSLEDCAYCMGFSGVMLAWYDDNPNLFQYILWVSNHQNQQHLIKWNNILKILLRMFPLDFLRRSVESASSTF